MLYGAPHVVRQQGKIDPDESAGLMATAADPDPAFEKEAGWASLSNAIGRNNIRPTMQMLCRPVEITYTISNTSHTFRLRDAPPRL